MRGLLLAFILIPILEVWLLLKVSSFIGVLPTIGLVILTAVLGSFLLRQQGLATVLRAREKMAGGALPASEMVEGICLAVGGALLLTPGFFTDAIGFICLIPGLRQPLLRWMLKRMAASGRVEVRTYYNGTVQTERQRGSARTIEGEFTRHDHTK